MFVPKLRSFNDRKTLFEDYFSLNGNKDAAQKYYHNIVKHDFTFTVVNNRVSNPLKLSDYVHKIRAPESIEPFKINNLLISSKKCVPICNCNESKAIINKPVKDIIGKTKKIEWTF